MSHLDLNSILSLPIDPDETWECGVIDATTLVAAMADEEMDQGMMLGLWRSRSSELSHANPIMADSDNLPAILRGLLEGLVEFQEMHDFPCRPAKIQCNDKDLAVELNKIFRGTKTPFEYEPDMPEWEDERHDLVNHLENTAVSEQQQLSLTDAEFSADQLRDFARAAAAFYRTRIWRYLDDVNLIKFKSPTPPDTMRFAVVLGADAETFGLAFYSEEETHYDLLAQRHNPDDLTLMSLTFESAAEISADTVQLWQKLNLPLETGDAYPIFHGFSPGEPRLPTARELDYATIVLQALSQTTEKNIDSGTWTKAIAFRGKQKRCELSIPNLTDPPDHQEWLHRGMMPERRGQERHLQMVLDMVAEQDEIDDGDELRQIINEKLVDSMAQVEYPMETPANRAAAYWQQAVESFGRRRIQLARQAIHEDPDHVDALVLLAEGTRATDERIQAFRIAVDAGRRALEPLFKTEAGNFWGIMETRPFMRACHGLALALDQAGQSDEAIEHYKGLLMLNSNDNQGIRYELVPLLISHNRELEAAQILAKYPEESVFWYYMISLIEYRRHGDASQKSKRAMHAAFQANEFVVRLLQSGGSIYEADAEMDEALAFIQECGDVCDETEGYTEFMYSQFFKWEKDRQKSKRDSLREARQQGSTAKKRKRR